MVVVGSQRRAPAALPPGKKPGTHCVFRQNRLIIIIVIIIKITIVHTVCSVYCCNCWQPCFLQGLRCWRRYFWASWSSGCDAVRNTQQHSITCQEAWILNLVSPFGLVWRFLARTYSGIRYSLHTVTCNKFCVGSYRLARFILRTVCFRQLFFFVRSEQRVPRLLGLCYKEPLFFAFFF